MCVCMTVRCVLVIKAFDRGEQLSRLVITSQQKHGQQSEERKRETND